MEQGNDIPSVIEEVFKRYTDGSYTMSICEAETELWRLSVILNLRSLTEMLR